MAACVHGVLLGHSARLLTGAGLLASHAPALAAAAASVPHQLRIEARLSSSLRRARSFLRRLPSKLLRGALPALAYSGLAGTTALALWLLVPLISAPTAVSMLGVAVGLPAASIALNSRGDSIAKHLGGVPAGVELVALAREAALAVGVPVPNGVYQLPAREPNAFACGLRSHTAVAVTAGLVDALSRDELMAVLAHEMGHLKHGDNARNMHVAIAATGLGGLYDTGRALLKRAQAMEEERVRRQAEQLLRAQRRRAQLADAPEDAAAVQAQAQADADAQAKEGALKGTAYMLIAGGLGMQAVAHLLRLAASRLMELGADHAAAEAYGSGSLISALQKIHEQGAEHDDLRTSAFGSSFAHAMISGGPAARDAAASAALEQEGPVFRWPERMLRLLRTHPPLEMRVAALRASNQSRVL